ncbi:MAG: N-methyl-L-tryptophan oxidase [Planctomycetes bacterium]|nr:N-methyl-L-tryptophan oxidase [Planctomycetota bacterium]
MTRRFDVIVAGAGGMGTAAAAHLARRGASVLALDRFPPGHARGSSHGQTRLIRLAYFEHPDYVPLLLRARASWRDLERETAATLLTECGLLSAGPAAGPLLAGTLRSARDHGLEVERLSGGEATDRWPAFRIPDPWDAVFEPAAGHLAVEACVRAHAEVAVRHGGVIEPEHDVRGWRVEGDAVLVETSRETVAGSRLVLCPGPWAAGLLRLPAIRFTVLRKSLYWYAPADSLTAADATALPTYAFDTPRGFFYGFPLLDGRGLKLAEHTGGREVADPFAVDRAIDPEEQAAIEGWSAEHLPGVSLTRTAHEVCLYTMSPDHHFVVGLHPEHPQVALAAGFSGHGFKFASAIGEVLADLALTGTTPLPVGFLAPTRPALQRGTAIEHAG